jgi:hypothetical protein
VKQEMKKINSFRSGKRGFLCLFLVEAKQQKSEAKRTQNEANKRSKTKNVKQNN